MTVNFFKVISLKTSLVLAKLIMRKPSWFRLEKKKKNVSVAAKNMAEMGPWKRCGRIQNDNIFSHWSGLDSGNQTKN